ncbi:KLHL18 [Lepeophtheirus salmonis]|uniref:Kelch-like protein diablo n=1 Tax=Lepeophtheirus salmonis TaxID=72036 RepID=A0A7R8CG59_LEPSM|nr:KLHL18 [Lepeophtheirus salmonis]CAF2756295.1 KLHL18 [Lepeophtheirus salmonis]
MSTTPSLFRVTLDEMDEPSLNEIHLSDGEDCILFTQPDLPHLAFSLMESIRREGKLCDVDLFVGDSVFPAHRVVLASAIPYFHAMFTSSDAFQESKCKEIRIRGDVVDPSALETLINFAYTGKISISGSNVQNLIIGASFFQLTKVKDACEEFLMTRLSPSNVLGVRQFADNLGTCISLVKACQKYIQKFFETVVKNPEFLALSFSQVDEIVNYDELHIQDESAVFYSIMNWTKHEKEDHIVCSDELIRNCHKCRDLVDEAKDFHLMPERRMLLRSFRTRPRRCKDMAGLIYAVGGQTRSGNPLSTVEVFDPSIGHWRNAEAMSMLRSRVGVSVMNNSLYAVGGYNGSDRLNTVEVFDAASKRWSKVADMNFKRSAVGAIALDSYLYVCGGFDGISSLNTVERYDSVSNSWTLVSSMTKNRSAAGVTKLFGQIYALGGHNGLSIFNSVEAFDPKSGLWMEVVPMLRKRCRLGVATLNGKIYACGGYDGSSFLSSVECFDPVTNKWSYIAPMNAIRSRVALVANMNKLWAIGGYDGMRNLSTVE